jgi:hypothetical protein
VRLSASTGPARFGAGFAVSSPVAVEEAWTPASFGDRLFAHFLAGTGETYASGRVVTWAGVNGVGGTLTAPGSSTTRATSATAAGLLGAVANLFDGNDQYVASGLLGPSAEGAAYTWILILDPTDIDAHVFLSPADGGTRIAMGVSDDFFEDWVAGVSFSVSSAASRTTGVALVLQTRVGSPAGATMRVNGAAVTLSAPTSTVLTPVGPTYLGALADTIYARAYVCEVIGVTGHLDAADLLELDAYTLATYGA